METNTFFIGRTTRTKKERMKQRAGTFFHHSTVGKRNSIVKQMLENTSLLARLDKKNDQTIYSTYQAT